jgi:hypothetical protein
MRHEDVHGLQGQQLKVCLRDSPVVLDPEIEETIESDE